jgi:hypothetical protein
MPGFDRNGPMGAGPMTGGGRGRCNPSNAGTGVPYVGSYCRGLTLRRGFRGGFSRGIGAGRGFGRGYGWYPAAAHAIAPVEPATEVDILKAEADTMKKSLEAINKRIEVLVKEKDEES